MVKNIFTALLSLLIGIAPASSQAVRYSYRGEINVNKRPNLSIRVLTCDKAAIELVARYYINKINLEPDGRYGVLLTDDHTGVIAYHNGKPVKWVVMTPSCAAQERADQKRYKDAFNSAYDQQKKLEAEQRKRLVLCYRNQGKLVDRAYAEYAKAHPELTGKALSVVFNKTPLPEGYNLNCDNQ